MSTTRRTINAKYAGRCWECRGPINPGDTVSYLPGDLALGRKGRTSHVACVEAPQQARNPYDDGGPAYDDTPQDRAYTRQQARERAFRRLEAESPLYSPYDTPDEPLREVERQMRSRPAPQSPPPPPATPVRREIRADGGFPVRRSNAARHVAPGQQSQPQATQPLVPGTPRERAEAYRNNPDCETCKRGGPGPSHNGSSMCRSGSLASGGHRSHCSCDTCY